MPPDTPGPDAIRAVLDKMLASPQLESSPSLCRFLRYVVEETLAGRGGMIKEYSLGAEVFGRGDDFDPRIDPIVRVQARNLRARMARYYQGPGAQDPVIIDMPKRTYVPVFTVRETPEAVEEIAAERVEAPAAEAVEVAPPKPRRTARVFAAAVAIALVSGAVSIAMHAPRKRHTPAAVAQDDYILGRFLLDRHGEPSLRAGVAAFEKAIAADGQYAAAYAGLADAYNMLSQNGHVPPPEGMEKARSAALRALAIDPDLAEGHVALAAVLEAYDWNWAGAEREYRRGIELNPTLPAAHLWYGMFLRDQGRLDEALPELRTAARLAPVSELTSLNFAYALMAKGAYPQALEQAELAAQLNPNAMTTQLLLAGVYRCLGREDDGRAALARAEAAAGDNPHGLSTLVGIYNRAGRSDKSVLLRQRLEELARQRYVSPFDLATASLAFGEEDRALLLLEEAYKQRSSGMIFLRTRNFAKMRQRAQFEQLIHRMHFAG